MKAKRKAPEMEQPKMSEFEIKRRKKEECLQKILSPMEGYIMTIQSILVWEKPKFSLAVLGFVTLLFWLATTVRVFYLIGITGTVVVFLEMWIHYIWPEIRVPPSPDEDTEGWTPVHPHLLSVPEMCCHLSTAVVYTEDLIEGAVNMRKRSHIKFFCCSTITFGCLAVFGTWVPGIYLSYFFVLCVLLGPAAFYHNIPQQLCQYIQPHITKFEEKFNIKRKRTKKGRKGKTKGGDVSMETSLGSSMMDSDSDEEISAFVPPVESFEPKAAVVLEKASLIVPESEEESTGLTPLGGATPERSLTPAGSGTSDASDVDINDEDVSQQGELSSFLPSVSDMPSINGLESGDFSLDVDTMPSIVDTLEDYPKVKEEQVSEEKELDTTLTEVAMETSSEMSEDPGAESMQFVSTHFKESESSGLEEEEGLEEGLAFPDVEEEPDGNSEGLLGQGQAAVAAALANPMVSSALTTIMTSTMAGLSTIKSTMSAAIQQQAREYTEEEEQSVVEQMAEAVGEEIHTHRQPSQDEISEEFEFLNEEDLEDIEGKEKGQEEGKAEVKESP